MYKIMYSICTRIIENERAKSDRNPTGIERNLVSAHFASCRNASLDLFKQIAGNLFP